MASGCVPGGQDWDEEAVKVYLTLEIPMGSNRPELSIFNLITSTLLALTCHNFKTFPHLL